MKKKFYDTHGAAKYIGGDEKPPKTNTLEGWRVQGKGPKYYRIGSLVRYDEADLDAWLEQQACTSTSQIKPERVIDFHQARQVTPKPRKPKSAGHAEELAGALP